MKPTRSQLDSMLASHPPSELLTPGVVELVRSLQRQGKHVYFVSGGFRQMIEPVAVACGVSKVTSSHTPFCHTLWSHQFVTPFSHTPFVTPILPHHVLTPVLSHPSCHTPFVTPFSTPFLSHPLFSHPLSFACATTPCVPCLSGSPPFPA